MKPYQLDAQGSAWNAARTSITWVGHDPATSGRSRIVAHVSATRSSVTRRDRRGSTRPRSGRSRSGRSSRQEGGTGRWSSSEGRAGRRAGSWPPNWHAATSARPARRPGGDDGRGATPRRGAFHLGGDGQRRPQVGRGTVTHSLDPPGASPTRPRLTQTGGEQPRKSTRPALQRLSEFGHQGGRPRTLGVRRSWGRTVRNRGARRRRRGCRAPPA